MATATQSELLHGTVELDFAPVAGRLGESVDADPTYAGTSAVYHHGRLAVDLCWGPGTRPDELLPVFSGSKGRPGSSWRALCATAYSTSMRRSPPCRPSSLAYCDPHFDVAFGYTVHRIPLPAGADERALRLSRDVRRCCVAADGGNPRAAW
jgi:hypothetical protein